MANELEGIAKNLAESVSGKGGIKLEKIMRALSTDSGKKILASLLSDGGEKVKRAAQGAKNGDVSGIQSIISAVSQMEEGKNFLSELTCDEKTQN